MSNFTFTEAAERANQTNESKGFREDWRDADWLASLSDELYDARYIGVEEFKRLHKIVETHRIMNLMTKLCLAAGEIAGEAADELRVDGLKGLDKDKWSAELADAHIRLLDLSSLTGVDIGEAVERKMDKNDGRPYKHGKAF